MVSVRQSDLDAVLRTILTHLGTSGKVVMPKPLRF